MTTFDDDMIRAQLSDGRTFTFSCKSAGVEWPPPESLGVYVPVIGGDPKPVHLTRVSYSEITDEQRAGMTHVFRGAQYEQGQR